MFLGVSFNADLGLMLLLEEMSGGTLQDYLLARTSIDKSKCWRIAHDISSALAFLHNCKPPVIHGDVNPENVLFNKFGEPKLADFGLSQFVNEGKEMEEAPQGHLRYLAPEVILSRKSDVSSDAYSFGILLLDLFTLRLKDEVDKTDYEALAKEKKSVDMQRLKSPAIKSLVLKCVNPEPKDRPPLLQISDEIDELMATSGHDSKCAIQ
mmetsp:Transcript_16677/g.23321  ORF Transcript_16677/g.23321 Transcript_16677/m.23321 type:complete len:209 (-) Transcript_16677:82-708(-)